MIPIKLIYITILLVLIVGLAILPFININVSVKSSGVVQPLTERNQLTSLVSGKINEIYIKKNAPVKRGQEVAEISYPELNEKLLFNDHRQEELNQNLSDIFMLQHMDSSSVLKPAKLKTAKYKYSLIQFRQQLRNNRQVVKQARRKFERNKELYKREVISQAKNEKSTFAFKTAQNNF